MGWLVSVITGNIAPDRSDQRQIRLLRRTFQNSPVRIINMIEDAMNKRRRNIRITQGVNYGTDKVAPREQCCAAHIASGFINEFFSFHWKIFPSVSQGQAA